VANDPTNKKDPSGKDFDIGSLSLTINIIAINYAPRIVAFAEVLGLVTGTTYLLTSGVIATDEVLFQSQPPDVLFALKDSSADVFLISSLAYYGGSSVALTPPRFNAPNPSNQYDAVVTIDRSLYPEAAQHIEDAQAAGQPEILTLDRSATAENRAAALQTTLPVQGFDRDEYPPAMTKEGGSNSDVVYVNPSDNRGAGASFGNQVRNLPDGARVKVVVK
jgi:hypothetical protein